MSRSIKIKSKITFSNVLVFCVFVGVIAGVLITDRNHLPEGWELPKVYFWQLFCLVFIVAGLMHGIVGVWQRTVGVLQKHTGARKSTAGVLQKNTGARKSTAGARQKNTGARKTFKIALSCEVLKVLEVLFVLGVFLVFVAVSFRSEYSRLFYVRTIENPLYRILIPLAAGGERFVEIPVAIAGNRFRDFGLITIVLILLFSQQLKKIVSRSNWNLIALAFILSALIQSVAGFFQFLALVRISPGMIAQGQWIFGTFGQANFYAGHLIIGLAFSLYYIKSRNSKIRILSLISTVLITVGIIVSVSGWGYLMMALVFVLVFGYEILTNRKFLLFSGVVLSTILLVFIFVVNNIVELLPEYSFRVLVWRNIINIYAGGLFGNSAGGFDLGGTSDLTRVLCGTGFDTLGEVFQSCGVLSRFYIDRAHNIFLDVFAATGVLGLTLFAVVIGRAIYRSVSRVSDRKVVYCAIVMVVLLVRAIVHTCSISNIMDAVIVIATLYGLFSSGVCPEPDHA